MAHPFFESTTYPFHRQDARTFVAELNAAFNTWQRVQALYEETAAQLPGLTLPAATDVLWREALRNLCAAGVFRAFCERLRDEGKLGPQVRAALTAVFDAEDPITLTLLSDDRLFFDREPLRDQLQRLATSSTYRVLLIRGGPDTGKSWTNYLISEIAHALGEEPVYLFAGYTDTVPEVLRALFSRFGVGKKLSELSTENATFKDACQDLRELAQSQQKVTWIMMDDLGEDETGPRGDPLVRQFFDQFALSMADPSFARWFRLVLIDYPSNIPTRWKDFWIEDAPDPTHANDSAIAKFVAQWATKKKKKLGEDDATTFAKDVIAAAGTKRNVPNNPPSLLQSIHDALKEKLKEL
ncbi:MAG TPA: hypothetical protein VF608_05085 [Thermoanaerobaculia bacterium]